MKCSFRRFECYTRGEDWEIFHPRLSAILARNNFLQKIACMLAKEINPMNILKLAIVLILWAAPARADLPPNSTLAYVGTYTAPGQSKGIYAFTLQAPQADSQTISLEPIGLAAQVTSPSFLAVDPRHRFLFAVNEVDQTRNQPGGGVSSFSIDAKTGLLTAINQQSSMGKGPCHIVVDKTGRNVIVANYGSGSVAA